MPEGHLSRSGEELRAEVETIMREDLIGPLGGSEEELGDAPIDRYLLGMLAPRFGVPIGPGAGAPVSSAANDSDEGSIRADAQPDDDLASSAVTSDSGSEGRPEERPPAVDQLVPSAFGLTFALDVACHDLTVAAEWGAYSRGTSDEKLDHNDKPMKVWQRRQCGGNRTIAISGDGALEDFAPDPAEPEVRVRGVVRERNGHRLVSLFLVNGQYAGEGREPHLWLLQAKLTVTAADGESAVFVRRPIDSVEMTPAIDRDEIAGLEMQYRDAVELAVGHSTAVDATYSSNEPDRGVRLETAAMPAAEVPLTEAPRPEDFDDGPIGEPFAAAQTTLGIADAAAEAQPSLKAPGSGGTAIRRAFTAALAALDMKTLAEAADTDFPRLLSPLVDAYEAWIAVQEQRIGDPGARLAGHEQTAYRHLEEASRAAARMRDGIAALADSEVAEAFRFANHAMWQQRVHSIAGEARRRDDKLKLHEAVKQADEPKNRSWRPFQLAFVLLNLPAVSDPAHPERQASQDGLVDLLFFPTGGGKTEAYLGLTAFVIAIRRLQGDRFGRNGHAGVAVLMRYTLRLLTLQQFQRAAALLCACELRRRALYGDARTDAQKRWGAEPMRIGLWVGQASTPNRTEDAENWVKQARARNGNTGGSSPMQLARCPWCGSKLNGGRDVDVNKLRGRTLLTCSDATGQCAFTPRNSPSEGLPVVVVDEEVYRLLPSLVIATVDKLAQMPWQGKAAALFGQVSRRCDRHGYLTPTESDHSGAHPARNGLPAAEVVPCEPLRPPDLIIQDELHLISGPLGSLVGLYETAVDDLSTWTTTDGERVRPKVIASTATIRRAGDQVHRLFDRRLAVFPPPGLDARDSFFALQRDRPGDPTGRRYLGVCAPGRRYKQVLIRVYVAQLRAAWTVLGRQPGEDADAYMTLVGYFNSLRELGGMRRLVEDDVQSRLFTPGGENRGYLILEELTSRKSAADIPATLDQLGVRRLSQDKPPTPKPGQAYQPRSIDVLLATNMISVGVDVPRLGAMVVAGQPKSTSEYIQATSRVGRQHPGMVITVYNWARPRDLSHFETFGHYHRTLYRQVEALSVTPFAPRALDRGLTGVVASLLRLCGPAYNDNPGAALVDPAGAQAQHVRDAIRERAADSIGQHAADELGERVAKLLEAWRQEAEVGQRTLVYKRRGQSDTDYSLLKEPGIEGWDRWTVPTSMRNVENPVPLALKPDAISRSREPWKVREEGDAS